MLRGKHIIAFGLVLVLALIFHLFFNESYVSVKQYNSRVETVTDAFEGGRSEVKSKAIFHDGIDVEFTLRKGQGYPFGGAKMVFDSIVDISGYDELRFTMQGSKTNNVPIVLGVEYLDKTLLPVQFLEYRLEIDSVEKEYKVSLSKFAPPAWWLNTKGIEKIDLKEIDFSKLQTVGVSNGDRSKIDVPEHITMTNIRFVKQIVWPYYLFGIGVIVGLILILKSLFKKKETEVLEIKYQAVKNQEESNKVVDFITGKYMENEMCSQFVQDELGVSESGVSKEVKNATGLSFKQFLNQLRIEEAKRLLKSTDLRVNEVSDAVGYDNVTHFNRTFKTMSGQSPTDYRKAHK